MNRKQWWTFAGVFFATSYIMFSAMTAENRGLVWSTEMLAVALPLLHAMFAFSVACFISGFLEKEDNKKK